MIGATRPHAVPALAPIRQRPSTQRGDAESAKLTDVSDEVSIGDEARAKAAEQARAAVQAGAVEAPTPEGPTSEGAGPEAPAAEGPGQGEAAATAKPGAPEGAEEHAGHEAESGVGLDDQEQATVQKLKARDREVRAHEAAHQAAGGGLAGAASFTTQRGPDGLDYAIGGEVPIDMGQGKTPTETIARAQRVRAAALAPANPSGADRSIAAAAAKMESSARAEQAKQDRSGGEEEAGAVGAKTDAAGAETEATSDPDAASDPATEARDPGEMRGGGPRGRHHHSGADCPTCAAQVSRYGG
jgi:SprA-related family